VVHEPPCAVRAQPPDAAHERMVTEHEAFAYGAADHEPLLQVEVRETDEHAAGDVTEDEE